MSARPKLPSLAEVIALAEQTGLDVSVVDLARMHKQGAFSEQVVSVLWPDATPRRAAFLLGQKQYVGVPCKCGGTLRHVGELFDQQTSGAMQQLQAFFEGRSETRHGHSPINSSRLHLPASNNTRQNLALENASHVMQILIAEHGGSPSQGKALFLPPSRCELVVSQSFVYPGLLMHMMMSPTGIQSIELVAPGKRPKYTHTFHFDLPIIPREHGSDLQGILSLYNAAPDAKAPTPGLTAESLKESALFKYLEYLELAFRAST